jgi:hypothetical protein
MSLQGFLVMFDLWQKYQRREWQYHILNAGLDKLARTKEISTRERESENDSIDFREKCDGEFVTFHFLSATSIDFRECEHQTVTESSVRENSMSM